MAKKTKIISILNQKGGVGKTTTTINLATAMVSFDKKILIVDLDPQGNASTGLGIDNKKRENNIYKALTYQNTIDDCILETLIPNLNIIPSTVDLSAAEIELSKIKKREHVLKKVFQELEENFDYIFYN